MTSIMNMPQSPLTIQINCDTIIEGLSKTVNYFDRGTPGQKFYKFV